MFNLKEMEEIRAADAKEVGVGNPAEETYRHPNHNPETSYYHGAVCQRIKWHYFCRGRFFLPPKVRHCGLWQTDPIDGSRCVSRTCAAFSTFWPNRSAALQLGLFEWA